MSAVHESDTTRDGYWSISRSPSPAVSRLDHPRPRACARWPASRSARSSTSAGRWLIMTSGVTWPFVRCRARARGTRSARPVRRHATSSPGHAGLGPAFGESACQTPEGGANPERTIAQRPSHFDTSQHEPAGQTTCGGTRKQRPRSGIALDTEEVTGSIPVSPTSENGLSRSRERPFDTESDNNAGARRRSSADVGCRAAAVT